MIKRIQNKVMNSLHKIGIKLYIYTILLILILFYPSSIGRISARNDTMKSDYIPKSKRGATRSLKIWLTKCLKNKSQQIMARIQTTPTRCNIRDRKRIAARINGANKHKHRLKQIVEIVIYPVLALMANQRQKGTYNGQRRVVFDTDSESIGIDNRCSACISNNVEDFVGQLTTSNRTIKGFGGTHIRNIMSGTLRWKWEDDNGNVHQFKIPNSYYVPDGGMRLLSPQHWAQTQIRQKKSNPSGIGSNTYHDRVTIYWNNNGNRLTVPINKDNNVATLRSAPGYSKFKLFCDQAKINYDNENNDPMICHPTEIVDDEEQENEVRESIEWPSQTHEPKEVQFDINSKLEGVERISNVEDREATITRNDSAELLTMHQKYGHISFRRLQEMARQGIINAKYMHCPIPTCSACMYAKAKRKRWRDKPRKDYERMIATNPGECISVDQMVSPTPGLIAQMTGSLTSKRYKYATIFVDQATGLGYVHLQKSADADETLQGKKIFEEYSRQRGVQIRSYQADNGIFRAHKWMDDCRSKNQTMTFTGVNAHHQNGVAERRIGLLQEHARAMIIHAQRKWSGVVTANLWPYAIRMANDCLNETPNLKDGKRRTADQIFSNSMVQPNSKHHKVFGCPTYVLDEALQQGNIFHKWKERTRVGLYLGQSPNHARNVALVLNIRNGLVSPQFHVQHDNHFDTVKDDKYESTWQIKAGFVNVSHKRKREEEHHTIGRTDGNKMRSRNRQLEISTEMNIQREIHDQKVKDQNASRDERQRLRENRKRINNESHSEGDRISNSEGVTKNDESNLNMETTDGYRTKELRPSPDNIMASVAAIDNKNKKDNTEIFCMESILPDGEMDDDDPLLAYKAVADPDVMYLHQAMKERDRNQFIQAMQKEVNDQKENGNFVIVRKDQVPNNKTILKSVWQMRRKRDIRTRAIKKYKARLNIDGSRMRKGIDYEETYAPVAKWSTIRLILSLAAVHKWHTRQLDYILAFPQAPVERELYMEVPKGFEIDEGDSKDYLLKIQRNIYGQKQAGRVWNKYLVSKLTNELGFKQSSVDECLFYRGNVLYALYTDDSILAGPNKGEIDRIIQEMRDVKLDITDKGNVEDFLGVNIEQNEDGTIVLTQPHLIDQILKDLNMMNDNVKVKDTPAASSNILRKYDSSEDFDNSFHYRSVIGKLNYLEKCTRPDIAYASHQCARFTENPKIEHAKAVRWLARYLKGTREKGIILQPDKTKQLNMYVDADFSGNWNAAESEDRNTARSRHGYAITYLNCPIIWKSQMQTEIALSSTESEYIGISQGLREVIPLMTILEEMKAHNMPIEPSASKVYCRVFEDNSGALEMARVHKFRPRTKHINVKYHHFRDYVSRGNIKLFPIRTSEQPADMLTKPLPAGPFIKHRKRLMGW